MVCRLILPANKPITDGLKNLIMKVLEKDPVKRATIEDLREDEWLNEGAKTPLMAEELSFVS